MFLRDMSACNSRHSGRLLAGAGGGVNRDSVDGEAFWKSTPCG